MTHNLFPVLKHHFSKNLRFYHISYCLVYETKLGIFVLYTRQNGQKKWPLPEHIRLLSLSGREEGAAGRIGKDLRQRIITCFMANEDYTEDLKLEIIHAIDDQSTGFDE